MNKEQLERIEQLTAETLVRAGSTFSQDKVDAYKTAIEAETNEHTRWVMEQILQNAEAAANNLSPLCDDTGIPHVILEVGPGREVSGEMLQAIHAGIAKGLRNLPGRPMGIKGDDVHRLDQSGGLDEDSAAVLPAPIQIRYTDKDELRLYVLMQGGGPAIRGKTYRVYHHHNINTVIDEIVSWAVEGVGMLGCSPCTLAIGIGRSHFEAAALMEQAMIDGRYSEQSDLAKTITDRVNEANIGGLGLGGKTSVLGTFLKVGPQRASGIRVVSLMPLCCFEPRCASVEL